MLDYLDGAINNSDVEPDLEFIKKSLIKVLNAHNHQIANLEMFSLIHWKQVLLNDKEIFEDLVPEDYTKMLDQGTGVEIQEVLDDLKWQSNQMQKVIIDNIETFQRSYFDLQAPLGKIEKISEDISHDKVNLEPEFNKIWAYEQNENFDDDFVLKLEQAFQSNFEKLDNVVKELYEFISQQTKKFKDKEYQITQKFTNSDAS